LTVSSLGWGTKGIGISLKGKRRKSAHRNLVEHAVQRQQNRLPRQEISTHRLKGKGLHSRLKASDHDARSRNEAAKEALKRPICNWRRNMRSLTNCRPIRRTRNGIVMQPRGKTVQTAGHREKGDMFTIFKTASSPRKRKTRGKQKGVAAGQTSTIRWGV